MPPVGNLRKRVLCLAHTEPELTGTAQSKALTGALVRLYEKYPALGLASLYHMLNAEYSCSRRRVHRLMSAIGIHSIRKKLTGPPRTPAITIPLRPICHIVNFPLTCQIKHG